MLQNVKKALANPEPSTHGTKQTWRNIEVESVMSSKADVRRCSGFTSSRPSASSITAYGVRLPAYGLIPRLIDQNPCAHWRSPMDMIFQGRSTSVFQA